MSDSAPHLHVFRVDLPETAPRVRITAGMGTATQKSWNLRRPVTLIGSRRPAHIVLHGKDVSAAHCVIVNTGTEVLLKDLHTRRGTRCGSGRIDLTVLQDGDVIDIAGNRIQVAIQVPENASDDSGLGITFEDPTLFQNRVDVHMAHTHQRWRLREAVALVGRHESAQILLDHDQIARRHAVFFKFLRQPAIFDLGGQDGVRVNGRLCSLAPLKDGDQVTIGPFRLRMGNAEVSELDVKAVNTETDDGNLSQIPAAGSTDGPTAPNVSPFTRQIADRRSGAEAVTAQAIDEGVDNLHESITQSWQQLNSWQTDLLDEATELTRHESDLAARQSELDALDAALRGQLHDVQRLEEQLARHEAELDNREAELNAGRDLLVERNAACEAREAEVNRRAEELSRREHIFAQRWSRAHAPTCSHCGRAI